MNQDLMQRFPAIADLALQARRRIPFFAWEYLDSGTGNDEGMQRNRDALAAVKLTPQFMKGVFEPATATELFGRQYAMPFGVAPIGLAGLIWPQVEQHLARSAAKHRFPYTLSTVATESVETIGPLTDGMGWFQLYPPRSEKIRRDLLKRADEAGFTTLLVTADVPSNSRRERQIKAGVSLPPRKTPRMFYRCALRPHWSLTTLRAGIPRFRGLEKYIEGRNMQRMLEFVQSEFGRGLDWDYLKAVRDEWPGPVVLKGVLDPEDAIKAVALGVDGIEVSNHGGRQFDGAPAAISMLPVIANAVGDRAKILFDSGIRSGLDIARALALGADFVLLGRAFMYAVAALGEPGGDHVAAILSDDLKNNMIQLGCAELAQLRTRLED